jgi:cysteine synthase B
VLLELVGNTPLLPLTRAVPDLPEGVAVLAKAEFLNPSGSVKDRAAKAMLLDGLAQGLLAGGRTILDATSGNTGISYAMFGAALGFPVKIYLPKNANNERKNIIRAFGAEIVETSPLEGSDGAYAAAAAEVEAHPGRYFFPDQYNNPANPLAHFNGTGAEILKQTGGQVTHFLALTGTCGTFTGTARRLKQDAPNVKTIAVQPDAPFHGIEGTRHLDSVAHQGSINDRSLWDGVVEISTAEAYGMTRRLAGREGLFVGISSGANVAAAVNYAKTLTEPAVVVTILCDTGTRYVNEDFWRC